MVRFVSALVGAAAIVANVAIAAPLAGRQSYDQSSGSSYQQPADQSSYQPAPQADQGPSYQPPAAQPQYQQPPQQPPQYQPPQYQPQQQQPPPPPPPMQPPTYGSGWSNWGSYNDCVQKCLNQYATPPVSWTPPPPPPPAANGTGMTHTVLVAPVAGSYKYTPFYVNANVGDKVRWIWAGPAETRHTVTHSSQYAVCNKTAEAPFASGVLNATGQPSTTSTFEITINDTNPIYYYCGVLDHCEKGMFGVINPQMAAPGSNVTLGELMPGMLSQNPDMMSAWSTVNASTYGTSAASWASGLNMSAFPSDVASQVAASVMYSQSMWAANPGMLEAGMGATPVNGTGLNIPPDVMALIASAPPPSTAGTSSTDSVASTDPSSGSNAAPASAPAPTPKNSAGTLVSSRAAVALVAAVAAVIAF